MTLAEAMTVQTLKSATTRIIDENPVSLSLTRVAMEDDGAGGIEETESEVGPFTVRVAELSSEENRKITDAGEITVHRVNLTAEWNADIQAKDQFTHDGRPFVVEFVREAKWRGYAYKKTGRAEEVTA